MTKRKANVLVFCPKCKTRKAKAILVTTSLSGVVRYWEYRCTNKKQKCQFGFVIEEPIKS